MKKDFVRRLGVKAGVFAVVLCLVFSGFVVFGSRFSSIDFVADVVSIEDDKDVVDKPVWREVASWNPSLIPLGAEASQAGSGFLGIYFCNHTASPDTAYKYNSSILFENWSNDNGFGYAHIDSFDLTFTSTDAFDIVVRCKFNQSMGPWNGSGWRDTWVRVNITLSDGVVISDETGTWIESYNSSSSLSYYGNVYWDNSGSGYTLSAGDLANIVEVSIETKCSG